MLKLVLFLFSLVSLTSGQEVTTTHGRIAGFQTSALGQSIDVFYGIPFAKPPNGDRRFLHPQPIESWEPAVKEAKTFKPSCPQPGFNGGPLRTTNPPFDEDCLYINVWSPAGAQSNNQSLPVMVWIYGGSFTLGSINTPLYDGKYLAAEENVIVMAVNYRIGALGFLYLGTDQLPGNQGMMDQRLGLKWIFENARRFGGDPDKITIFGQSAGGVSVGLHMLSPLSKDFFNRVILQSGPPNSFWATRTPESARNNARVLAGGLNCTDSSDAGIAACVMQQPVETILQQQAQVNTGGLPFTPVIDGYFIPQDPKTMIENGAYTNKDLLIGVIKNEATPTMNGQLPTIFPNTDTISINEEQFMTAVRTLTGFQRSDDAYFDAIIAEYVDSQVPALRNSYVDITDELVSDISYNCPTASMGNSFSQNNSVFMYSFEHRLSTLNIPQWYGVGHSFELEILFGHPLAPGDRSTQAEKDLTKAVMQYWANFARNGNPNSASVSPWPGYDTTEEKYLVLDLTEPKVVRQGLRKDKCVFWDKLITLIPDQSTPASTQAPASTNQLLQLLQSSISRRPAQAWRYPHRMPGPPHSMRYPPRRGYFRRRRPFSRRV